MKQKKSTRMFVHRKISFEEIRQCDVERTGYEINEERAQASNKTHCRRMKQNQEETRGRFFELVTR